MKDEFPQDTPWAADQGDKILSAIFVSLGEASMCWSERPSGIFESETAIAVGENLYNEIIKILFTNKGQRKRLSSGEVP